MPFSPVCFSGFESFLVFSFFFLSPAAWMSPPSAAPLARRKSAAVHGRSIPPPAAHPSPPFAGDHRRLPLLTKPAVHGKPTAVRGCQKPAAIHGHCKPAAIRGQRKPAVRGYGMPAVRGYGKSAGTWFSATGHGATVGVCCTHPNPRIFLTSTGSVQPFSVSAGLLGLRLCWSPRVP